MVSFVSLASGTCAGPRTQLPHRGEQWTLANVTVKTTAWSATKTNVLAQVYSFDGDLIHEPRQVAKIYLKGAVGCRTLHDAFCSKCKSIIWHKFLNHAQSHMIVTRRTVTGWFPLDFMACLPVNYIVYLPGVASEGDQGDEAASTAATMKQHPRRGRYVRSCSFSEILLHAPVYRSWSQMSRQNPVRITCAS